MTLQRFLAAALVVAATAALVKAEAEAEAEADAFHNGFPAGGHGRFPGGGRSLNAGPGSRIGGGDSQCALLLPGPGKSHNRDYALGVFNGIGLPIEREGFTCITFQSVDAAFKAARDRLGLPRPSPKPDPRDLGNLGLVLTETTRNLAKQYNLPKDVLLNGMPLIDTFRTIIGKVCPDFMKPTKCELQRYRHYNGRCNNLENPLWGSTNTAFKRRLPPAYADGIDAPRTGHDGYPLPSARVVSAHLHRDEGLHDHAVTIMTVAWGQAIDHDMTLTAETKDPITNSDPQCCKGSTHPECFPIHIPDEDPFYSLFGQKCIPVVRSVPGVRYGCKLGPRSQINQITSFLDANWVYGSEGGHAGNLRLHRGGLMKSLPVFREFGMKDLLPLKLEHPGEGCIRPSEDVYCFDAGDGRVNEQLVLTVVHTLLMREHNRVATGLYQYNPHWDDDKLYHETRHILAAIVQHITYNEFLPMVLGKEVMQKYNIILEKHGYFNGYDPKVDPSMSNDFITSAFRFGHSLLPSTIERWSPGNKYIGSQRLSHMLRQPYDLYKGGWCDQYIMGLTNQVAQAMDDSVTQEVTNHLFQDPDRRWGMDLAAINMQRGREHGVNSYNEFREFCGLPRARTFHDLLGTMTNKTVGRYQDVYRHPDDIDLWSGGVSERPLPGSMIGPTFNCLIGLTFKELRHGDRFWYENEGFPSSFTLEQLDEIRKVKLSRIICDNSDDIKHMQVYAMVLPDNEINPRVPCNSGILPRMDLSKWRDPHGPQPLPPHAHVLEQQLDIPLQTKNHFKSPTDFSQTKLPSHPPKQAPNAHPHPPPHPPPHAKPPHPQPPQFGPVKQSSELHVSGPSSSYGPPPGPSSSYGPPPGPSSSYGPPPGPSSSYGPPPGPSPSYGPPPPVPSSSYGPPPPSGSYGPPPPSNSYGPPPHPEPVPEPEPHHGPPASYGPPPPRPHHHNFNAPGEYCEGDFRPLPPAPHYGPPHPVTFGGHYGGRPNPIRRFFGMFGL
ncbi:peroxidase-like [Eriocheir sinensis]|uniref:peroxidase-like n=1 Tax=Eriocheir sinensis TaxID=95602 RepID=UPI0021C9842E|nr:peroxidase-like [Eriocheir sinensis]